MIIATSKSETGATFLLLGLSRVNIERLLDGQPINLTRESHGNAIPEGLQIGILFGETEQDMARQLKDAGLVTPETQTTVDPRFK